MSIENLSRQFEAHHSQVVALSENFADMQAQLDRVEVELKRPRDGAYDDGKDSTSRTAYLAYVRRGVERMPHDLQNVLQVGDDPSGGFLAPKEYERQLERDLTLFSPVRSVARVGTTNSGEVLLPKRTTPLTGYWTGELEQRQASTPAYGLTSVPVGEITCFTDVSTRQVDDGAFDIGAELTRDFAEAFAAVEGAAFINGDGTKGRPEGILRAPGIPTVASGAATNVTVDALIAMALGLAPTYRARAVWGLNSSTLSELARKKNGDGAYIFQQALQVGQKSLLLGLPVIECPDMPDLAAGSKSIVLGDWSKYRIFDKPDGTSVLRDPFSVATSGIIRFHARRRVGATLTMPSAFRIMVTGI